MLFNHKPAILVLVIVFLGSGDILGQDKSTYYTVRHPEKFSINWTAFYGKIDALTARTRRDFPHELDIAYGPHSKQKLDLYFPRDVKLAPVFIFLHGGGFREGDRAHYGFVARPFVQHGIITAVASYRLASQGFHYPSQVQDVRAALDWIFSNIRSRGGDPDRIFVGGHSAGAILTADVALKEEWLKAEGLPANLVKGGIAVSGHYDLRRDEVGKENYVDDSSLLNDASPLLFVSKSAPPMVVAVGSVETAYRASSQDFVRKLGDAGTRVQLLVLEGATHDKTALALGDSDSRLFRAALDLIQGRIFQKTAGSIGGDDGSGRNHPGSAGGE